MRDMHTYVKKVGGGIIVVTVLGCGWLLFTKEPFTLTPEDATDYKHAS